MGGGEYARVQNEAINLPAAHVDKMPLNLVMYYGHSTVVDATGSV
jgi:hypothetical protein